MGPINVVANATSSTTIVVSWGDVPSDHRNGIIERFKVNLNIFNQILYLLS